MYKWIGLPRSVIKLIKELMRKCKTRLEIWSDGYCVGSYKMIAAPQLDFVSVKYQYVYYSNIAVDTEWESQAIVL